MLQFDFTTFTEGKEPKWMKKNAIAVNKGRKAREARKRERDNAAVKI